MLDAIDNATHTVRGRWKLVRVLEAALLLAAVLAGGAVALFALDNVLHLPTVLRIVLGAALVAACATLWVRRFLLPLLYPVSRDEAVILIERAMPDLDNRLINAERLARDPRTPREILALIHAEAAELVALFDLRRVLPLKPLKPLAVAAGGATLLLLLYAAVLPDYFGNAFRRYTQPGTYTPPITRTLLRVEPGDITVPEGATVSIHAEVSGEIPTDARVRMGDTSCEMRFLGSSFAFDFQNVDAPFDYSVSAGDAQSDIYHVKVQIRPKIQKLTLKYVFPDYLKLPPHDEESASGNVSAVEGTHIFATVLMTAPVKDLKMAASEGVFVAGADATWNFTVSKDSRYWFEWADGGKSATYTITSLKDNPPTVRLLEPSRDQELTPNAEFSVVVQATDDFGLAGGALKASRGGTEAFTLSELPMSGKQVRASNRLRAADLKLKLGDTLALFAVARDLKGQESTSGVVHLRIVSENQAQADALKAVASLVQRLRAVIVIQKRVKEQTAKPNPALDPLVKDQTAILRELGSIYAAWNAEELLHLAARGRLERLIRGPAMQAVSQLRTDLTACQTSQGLVISEVEGIISELEGFIAEVKKSGLDQAVADSAEKTPKQEARDLLAGLKEFSDAQKKVLEESLDMKLKGAEDFSDADKKKLETLRQTEEEWGKFFQEKTTDLSKLPPQDFSNGALTKQVNELFSELKQAAEQLDKKAVEMAIPLEESGLELAKSITQNTERWLSAEPDNQKWNMEENTKDVDVPMQDLPAELEDIVGDLIDKEDKLADDAQDVTSSWMDSLDKGAGWGVADGPIADMSAKGITGNLNPNSSEIAGRSGEGRSGKSSGQFVQDTAEGKGGKQTPSRSTADPFEAGRVDDKSKDPTGGSTGGGKISGANKEGLRGIPPPPTREKMDRLADNQADLRNTAERAKVGMERRGYVSQDLSTAIDKMKTLEGQLRARQGANYVDEVRAISEKLGGVKKIVQDQIDVARDPSRPLTQQRRNELYNALDEPVPSEFKDWVKEYYKALSE